MRSALALAPLVAASACASTSGMDRAAAPAPSARSAFSPAFFASGPASQCVPFARAVSGIAIYGDANTWWRQAAGIYPQSRYPSVGSVLALKISPDGSRGHVAVVREIVDARTILVDHANWHGREEIVVAAPVRDVSPPGREWTSVQVWWLDADAWGAKSYEVQGFIHPR